jgi:hypothetical protein
MVIYRRESTVIVDERSRKMHFETHARRECFDPVTRVVPTVSGSVVGAVLEPLEYDDEDLTRNFGR